MRISILVNSYNYGRYLGAAIASALDQRPAPHEVVVVDDGSTDGSRAIIAGYGDRVVPVLKPNGGQASAFNAGVAASSGDILCFLDADDLFLPGKTACLAEAFSRHADAQWCFHPLRRVAADLTPLEEGVDPPRSSGRCDLRADIRRNAIGILPTSTSGMAIRRPLAARLFPMPESPDVVLSDNYIKLRCVAAAPGILLAEPLALLRIHGDNRYSAGGAARSVRAPHIHARTALELLRADASLRRFCGGMLRSALRDLADRDGWRAALAEPAVHAYLGMLAWPARTALLARVAAARLVRRSRVRGP